MQADADIREIRLGAAIQIERAIHIRARFHINPYHASGLFFLDDLFQVRIALVGIEIEPELRWLDREFHVKPLRPHQRQHIEIVLHHPLGFAGIRYVFTELRKYRPDAVLLQFLGDGYGILHRLAGHESLHAALNEFVFGAAFAQPRIRGSGEKYVPHQAHGDWDYMPAMQDLREPLVACEASREARRSLFVG